MSPFFVHVRNFCASLALAGLAFTTHACTDRDDSVTNPTTSSLRLSATFVVYGSAIPNAPLTQARLTARRAADDEVLATTALPISPDDDSWNLDFAVPGNAGSVIALIELINSENSVEWSGETPPITVSPGRSTTPKMIRLYRGPAANLRVTALSLTPREATVPEMTSIQLGVSVQPDTLAVAPHWSSLDTDLATVSADGVVAIGAAGTARIVVEAGPHADTAFITATQRPASIVVIPDTLRIEALLYDFMAAARVLDWRGGDIANSEVLWSSSDPGVVEHIGGGRFRSRSNGVANITAASYRDASVRDAGVVIVSQRLARVTVIPVIVTLAIGAEQAFMASLADPAGHPMSGGVRWTVSDPGVAVIDGAGIARATGIGTTEIVATAGTSENQVLGRALLHVLRGPPEPPYITVAPSDLTFAALGDTARIIAALHEATGAVMPGAAFTWTSSNPAVVSVSGGLVRAEGEGSATVRVESNGAIATVNSQVSITGGGGGDDGGDGGGNGGGSGGGNGGGTSGAIARLRVFPDNATLREPVERRSLNVQAFDAGGNQVPVTSVAWSSSAPEIVSVNPLTGVLQARANGTVTISATAQGVVGTAVVHVDFSSIR